MGVRVRLGLTSYPHPPECAAAHDERIDETYTVGFRVLSVLYCMYCCCRTYSVGRVFARRPAVQHLF